MKKIFFVNGKEINFNEGETVLQALLRNRIDVPFLCYHPDLDPKETCGVCIVEIDGKQITSCSVPVIDGMRIKTESLAIRDARRVALESIFSRHYKECNDCVWNPGCKLLLLAKEYEVDTSKFLDKRKEYPCFKFGPSLEFDSLKCINCGNCIEVCKKQGTEFLELKKQGDLEKIIPSKDPSKDCTYCGQCILHCPVGAFEAVGEFESLKKPLGEKGKIVIFQIAPAVRVSIGEEFGLPPGKICTGELVASLKEIGGDWVFDISSGADFTTIEESKEVLMKKKEELPIFTSCCPSWVRFIEFNHPELIPNLASTRSPHTILGGIIKTFWAEKNGIDPQNIFIISIMPCVSKKFEIERDELKISGMKPVDQVLTVREVARMIKHKGIDLAKINPLPVDNPFGKPSGSGIIYGLSGGVMESALRNIGVKDIEFKKIREGVREAEISIGGEITKAVIVNGLGNVSEIIDEIKNNPRKYHCVEVMTCPGGCLGGGGQPLPSNNAIKEKRRASLRKIDEGKVIKKASDNPAIKEVYNYFKTFKNSKKVFHTHFKKPY